MLPSIPRIPSGPSTPNIPSIPMLQVVHCPSIPSTQVLQVPSTCITSALGVRVQVHTPILQVFRVPECSNLPIADTPSKCSQTPVFQVVQVLQALQCEHSSTPSAPKYRGPEYRVSSKWCQVGAPSSKAPRHSPGRGVVPAVTPRSSAFEGKQVIECFHAAKKLAGGQRFAL